MNEGKRGGGQLQLMGTHLLDLLKFWLSDLNFSKINIAKSIAVPERIDEKGKLRKVTSEDGFVISGKINNSLITISNTSYGHNFKGLNFQICGTKGALIYSQNQGLLYSKGIENCEEIKFKESLPDTSGNVFATGTRYFYKEYLKARKNNDFSGFANLKDSYEVQLTILR